MRLRRLVSTGERGQASIALLAGTILLVVGVVVFARYGSVLAARGHDQRTADLTALAAAQQMARDHERLSEPPLLPDGTPNPRHIGLVRYRLRARQAATRAARTAGDAARLRSVRLSAGPAPTAVTVELAHRQPVTVPGGEPRTVTVRARARAELHFEFNPLPDPLATHGSGGGYDGPLAYRQGKPLRPDTAAAFDHLAAAARSDGFLLTVNSGFRSDAEQARLFAARPDPRWVAPPGTSLHRYGTEIDIGPPAAYDWLAANARRFGFIKRYAWEPWHFGFGANPRDVPAQYGAGSRDVDSGSHIGPQGLPSWVPQQLRATIIRAATRHNIQPVLLAAQLKAESNFNADAVSPAGAQGIAQFMPGTARSLGLADPFDPQASIFAQAKLMADLIRQFGSIPLALAAYNAGPGAVQRHNGIPPFAETRAYIARILGLIKAVGGVLDDPAFAGLGFTARAVLVR